MTRVDAITTWQQARAIYLPGGNIPTGASPALAVAIALTELVASYLQQTFQ